MSTGTHSLIKKLKKLRRTSALIGAQIICIPYMGSEIGYTRKDNKEATNMDIYLAIDSYNTGEVKAFLDLSALSSFAVEHEYGYDYIQLTEARPIYLTDLVEGDI